MSCSKALSPCLVDELPRELLAAVFAYLSPLELVRCEQVCTWWNEVGRSVFDGAINVQLYLLLYSLQREAIYSCTVWVYRWCCKCGSDVVLCSFQKMIIVGVFHFYHHGAYRLSSTMHISICFFFFSKVLHVEAPLLWKAIILSELVPDVNRKERSHPRLVATEPALLTLKAAKNLYLHLVNLIQHYRCFFPFLFREDVIITLIYNNHRQLNNREINRVPATGAGASRCIWQSVSFFSSSLSFFLSFSFLFFSFSSLFFFLDIVPFWLSMNSQKYE